MSMKRLNPFPLGAGGARGQGVSPLEYAKFLRSNQTEAEERLWYYLRAHRFMGLKFKRQKPIGPYIVDFVCMEYRLLIEADGGQHGGDEDARRDAWFQGQGFTILRFWNNEILGQTEAVLERIRQVVSTLSPSPSPVCGRGAQEALSPGPSPACGRGEQDASLQVQEAPLPRGERGWGEGQA